MHASGKRKRSDNNRCNDRPAGAGIPVRPGDSVTVIPLETADSCLISTISRIVKQGDRLYVLDQKINTFFCFDLNGKLQFKIDRSGNGPGEYQYIEAFAVSSQGEIFLLEPWGNLYWFDSAGRFREKIRLPGEFRSYNELFAPDTATLIGLSWTGDVVRFSLSDTACSRYRLDTAGFFTALKRSYVYRHRFHTFSLFDGKVQILDEAGFSDCYGWDFGKWNNSPASVNRLKDKINHDKNARMLDFIGPGKLLKQFIYKGFETDRYRIALSEYKNDFLHVFHDKKEGRNYIFNRTNEGSIFHTCTFCEDVFIHYPQPLATHWRDLTCFQPGFLSSAHKKRIAAWREEVDNPYVVLFWLRK